MKKTLRTVSCILACSVLFTGCYSTTMIESVPSNAKVFIDGEYVGETPYSHTDSKIVGSTMIVKIEKEGFQPKVSSISKDEEPNVGAIIGGVFFMVPFLWTMQYKPSHTYELKSLSAVAPEAQPVSSPVLKSKVEVLRELKALLDDKVITPEEFEKEKAKILSSGE